MYHWNLFDVSLFFFRGHVLAHKQSKKFELIMKGANNNLIRMFL